MDIIVYLLQVKRTPIGMNYQAQPLQPHEIQKMKADPTVVRRVIKSYRLMLDFYGMELLSSETGLLKRSGNYAARYHNLLREYQCC